MSLRPSSVIQKILISTPAEFIGEFSGDGYYIGLAWPGYAGSRHVFPSSSPLARRYFTFSFETKAVEPQEGLVIPDYEPTGEFMCAMLALFFGKRFDTHGALEMTGAFRLPDLNSAAEICEPTLPFHGKKPRVDFPVELNLGELSRFKTIFEESPKDRTLFSALQTGSLFYLRALRAADTNPEVAYLHLITAGERIAAVMPFDPARELDAAVSAALERIEKELRDGTRVAGLFRSRLRQLKKRYCAAICNALDEDFFERTESSDAWGKLKKESFPRATAAAYDLRSRYVHTGVAFGSWVRPRLGNEERQLGKPIVGDTRLGTMLFHAPTFVGLERLTRVALLRLAESLGAKLSPLE